MNLFKQKASPKNNYILKTSIEILAVSIIWAMAFIGIIYPVQIIEFPTLTYQMIKTGLIGVLSLGLSSSVILCIVHNYPKEENE